ncbi:protein SMAX1-like [Elaeis guineensis]|uniref:Protein SMAX1-like n=1 Tax=Elaeis guineensis var. tenera TaxID=51953 RepID=A0A6I9RLC8_ELAGV|nr:protein SMAX1-like [Elaeis guineensis]
MRAGLSTIQQTLTPEAASVLTQSIKEAARRNHGQTTPLHVAATLLAAPSGLLRQACVRSHPHSSHPLQCRALELCFSVALDRLPASSSSSSNPNNPATNSTNSNPATNSTTSSSSSGVAEPPISNALMAALKRAQANQRRGCPEQQQQPLLAVKVELEQLIVSILDDPSVSRVMREASFSSTAVKTTIEQSLASSSAAATAPSTPSSPSSALGINLAHRATPRNLYINPRLHQSQANTAAAGGGADPHRREEVTRVVDILMRSKKRNPVLVGDSDPGAVMREVLQRIESGDAPSLLRAAQIISVEKEFERTQIPSRIGELGRSIEARIGGGHGIVLNLGDLKWLVESPAGLGASLGPAPAQPQAIISEMGRAVVVEMGRLLKSFGESGRLWLVGTATCATYLRCQVYHPTMENDWDLQALPIAPRSPHPSIFPRLGGNGILSSSVETLAPMKGFTAMGTTTIPLRQPPEGADHSQWTTLCPPCMQNYEREVAKLAPEESEKSSSKPEAHQALPQWLQLAKLGNGDCANSTAAYFQSKEQESVRKPSPEELLKKWRDTCSRLHPKFQPMLLSFERPQAPALRMPVLGNSTMVNPRPPFEPKLTLAHSPPPLQMNSSQRNTTPTSSPEQPFCPPGSPVKTDLVLGHSKDSKDNSLEKTHKERMKDLAGCMQDGFSEQQRAKTAGISDIDSFKRLSKGLTERVGWQPEAASTVATVVMQCKSGNGKQRSFRPKSDTWLLFIGPDKVGKSKMATALSELVFGTGPVTVNFGGIPQTDGNDGESKTNFRGRTSLDRVVEAIRRNPFSVVVLEDIDRADGLVQGSIKHAIERGRLPDSYGREVSLGSVIFILTADWLPEELRASTDSIVQCEQKILDSANCGWQLELSIEDSPAKRRADWRHDDDRTVKPRKELSSGTGLSLDLNLAAGVDDDVEEGSRNSSDLTVEHELGKRRLAIKCSTSSAASELMELVDDAVVFKPVDFGPLRRKVSESVSAKFATVMGGGRSIRIDEHTLDWMVGSLWLAGATSSGGFEDWVERVLVPSIEQLKGNLKVDDGMAVVRLSTVKGGQPRRSSSGNWLPGTVAIAIDGR